MIIYVVPLIKDGVEIGVVGIDIRFDLFSNTVLVCIHEFNNMKYKCLYNY
ncbi:hypothetical protein [Bacillus sp. FJAT-52991]|uniref:Uncharacterized protein n=1 Tax=Bacillus kandeliae TaxID=3129297 RepID=A0ABZ2N5A6_9BACI